MQSKYYTDPFGNNTEYSYPDQYTVRQQGERFKGHTIYRAVESYAHSEAQSASRSVSVGHGFFKASVKVKHAQSVMSDGLHVVTGTKHQIGLYEIDLDPGFLLTLDDKLQRCLEYLPEEYDPARYEEVGELSTPLRNESSLLCPGDCESPPPPSHVLLRRLIDQAVPHALLPHNVAAQSCCSSASATGPTTSRR